MWGILVVLHVIICIVMIMIILLQTGKGAEIGAAFGGGYSQTLFGSAGPVGFLNKLTTVVAIMFMMTSLLLALMAGRPHTPPVRTPVPMGDRGPSTPLPFPGDG